LGAEAEEGQINRHAAHDVSHGERGPAVCGSRQRRREIGQRSSTRKDQHAYQGLPQSGPVGEPVGQSGHEASCDRNDPGGYRKQPKRGCRRFEHGAKIVWEKIAEASNNRATWLPRARRAGMRTRWADRKLQSTPGFSQGVLMLKIIGWAALIIFIIGLLVVFGVFNLIF
jgi:hypothetical protein